MKKIKLGIVFGGMSTENEISKISALSVIDNIDTDKYEIFKIYITKDGEWQEYKEITEHAKNKAIKQYKSDNKTKEVNVDSEDKENTKIENVMEYLKKLDVVFPVLHGLYGEDGTIQGLFELINLPYVGCKVLASSVGMDKVYTKIIFEKAGLKQVKYEYIRKYKNNYIYVNKNFEEEKLSLDNVVEKIIKNQKFPMYVKPSNSGSSIGINKAKNIEELKKYIEYASEFDNKILIEEGVIGREVECAVLGNEEVIASGVGEIKPADEYYSYDAKYNNKASITEIPVQNVDSEIVEKIRKQAVKAFKAIDGKGLSRVDFFIEQNTNEIYINEINTLPGFTSISMYPKLFEASGITYKDLIDKIIMLGLETNNKKLL